MNTQTVKNWVKKAENDLKTGKDEMQTVQPATDTICFHMQQCVEKYLKAFLIFNGKEIRKTHDISELLVSCNEINPDFEKLMDIRADNLTKYAVEVRYGDEYYFPTLEETEEAIRITEKVKEFIKVKIFDNIAVISDE